MGTSVAMIEKAYLRFIPSANAKQARSAESGGRHPRRLTSNETIVRQEKDSTRTSKSS